MKYIPNYKNRNLDELSKIENIKLKPPNNTLDNSELRTLNRIKSNKNIIIKPTDKNLGITILENGIYKELCEDHLKDNTTYKPIINPHTLDTTLHKIISLIHHLHDHKHISIDQHNRLLPKRDKSKLGTFYILPKLHKKELGVRPIISNINHPTEKMSKFIHQILHPLVKTSKTFLNNSLDLIHQLREIKPRKDFTLITADISSLYTNIPTKEGISLTTKEYQKFQPKPITTIALQILLNNILNNNFFLFDQKIFLQINGTAMGTSMAPTYANIFLKHKEENWLNSEPLSTNIILFKRYIDDILIIYNNQNHDQDQLIQNLKKCYEPLTLTTETSTNSINYLDLTLSLTPNQISTKIYRKTYTNNIIPYNSNHPKHILENVITNESLRINRINQNPIDNILSKKRLLLNATNRGYPKKLVKRLISKGGKKPIKKEKLEMGKFLLLTYNHDTPYILKQLHKYWDENNIKKPNIIYKMNPSIQKTLVRSTFT